MAATVTLSTTTLSVYVGLMDGQIRVASTSGILPKDRLWIDRELMGVISLGPSTLVNVLRGVGGTSASAHSSSAVVTIGRGDQFYSCDPVGAPASSVSVQPYIRKSVV